MIFKKMKWSRISKQQCPKSNAKIQGLVLTHVWPAHWNSSRLQEIVLKVNKLMMMEVWRLITAKFFSRERRQLRENKIWNFLLQIEVLLPEVCFRCFDVQDSQHSFLYSPLKRSKEQPDVSISTWTNSKYLTFDNYSMFPALVCKSSVTEFQAWCA